MDEHGIYTFKAVKVLTRYNIHRSDPYDSQKVILPYDGCPKNSCNGMVCCTADMVPFSTTECQDDSEYRENCPGLMGYLENTDGNCVSVNCRVKVI